ncbi:Uncharacterised protein [Mycobacteroides abscessus subsp. abscessus]|uniref:hypothetical protein n=1 Tax=Mycobacteroides abscessus TaxID=36809 RepID=UPI0009268B7B|nr:hypothetical protein [Mycobacteroides abscessus]SHV90629.1 Uncharacterised protein [Mycobacteroides abscessus subsp. abscessus]SHW14033.1 Uncharacterised protein [Mycobacteroides abscessus subsp. abscessus]SHW42925.1 Uncharacterised protein [Mycobacteroides abscessus subsp. abscessus]SIB34223.1 Uncharacterised protein [Mycobacteroides abscessus subsp. abscessus]SIC04192.1 Uncharacterised protein [Mycobacteroides abscessus subsp. abscessus]
MDQSYETDLDRVAEDALDLVGRLREDDPRRVFEQLRLLAELHPAKYAQIAMALAAFVNPDEGTVALRRRVDAIVENRAHLSASAS